MGNEKSSPQEMKSEETIEVCEYWTQESTTLTNSSSRVCVFKQSLEDDHKAQKLLMLSHNLKLYRHPNILRFVSTWQSKGILHLATEDVKPLNQLLDHLMPMQLCVGLKTILNAVVFLHEKASVSHNSLSIDAIYVNGEGSWKLGKLESMTSLQFSNEKNDRDGFAKFALNILEDDVEDDDVPGLTEFKDFCTNNVSDVLFFSKLSNHRFFNHKFIEIYTFLTELPIKYEEEKSLFFKTLAENLAVFPEKLVAQELGNLLLSRLVLLNEVAQSHLLPKIFIARNDHYESLFSHEILKEYLRSKLLNIFGLRDAQIRLILLRYFSSLCTVFTKQQLELKILPELLTGLKDTNEQLVAATLYSLADLVPVLGASVVVGLHRTKLFADGRPLMNLTKAKEQLISPKEDSPANNTYILTERPSPDGGEDFIQSLNVITENNENTITNSEPEPSESVIVSPVEKSILKPASASRKKVYIPFVQSDDDLCALDIKCSRTKKDTAFDDIDLIFKDMEPVILQTASVNVNEASLKIQKNKFEAVDDEQNCTDGWGEDVSDLIGTEELL